MTPIKSIFYLIFCSLFILSCTNEAEIKLQKLQEEYNTLSNKKTKIDTVINDNFKLVNEIESNLSLISKSEKSISLNLKGNVESKKSTQDKILDEIKFINSLIEKNKETIHQLNNKVNHKDKQLTELNKMIASLNERIQTKNHEIIKLKNKLLTYEFTIEKLNISLDSITFLSEIQQQLIDAQREDLNTAYFCFGTAKELIRNKVISKEGGIIGIGKTKKLSKDFNKNYFQKIDITTFFEIPLAAKKAKLVTSHPSSSYEFIGKKTIKKLLIKDPDSFWSASKYLVIVVE